ncbi:amidohydrolase family protein [Defluviimonas sp. WL0024]|uniref:Amidohydrolase family protein n=2 Tax=Albidovulum TaxID=205889 RepID=A0ABT3J6T3_9RHOB|nr:MULTISPECIES: amidohydrolase family protein [Defluviimonas]MCU9850114.1 amidohydrolase family protein [Defluviimonas sp. WL0024]MCW3783411.1 amidohydrolase family protein [Defluviimonas salinarum]
MKNRPLTFLLCTTIAASPVGAIAHDSNHAVVPAGVVGEIETTNVKMKFDNVVIRGAQVFNGCDEGLADVDVLVSGQLISTIDANVEAPEGAFEINAEGYTLIPGLIDAHWHGIFAEATIAQLALTGEGYWNLLAAKAQNNALSRGFTTVRDTAGPMFDIAKATDQGLIDGPRVFPSGPALSITAGHQDFRLTREVPQGAGELHSFERGNMFYITDGVADVLKRTRENLMQGATQIKLMAGGGVTSAYDPIHTIQFTDEEFKAAVEATEAWGTYVTTHAINDEAVVHSIENGAKSVEHAHMATRETLQMFKDNDVWLSMQPFLDDEDAPALNEFQKSKYKFVTDGTDFVYRTAKELGLKIAFGTDTLFSADLAKRQGAVLAKMQRWFTPYETLKMATCDNAELLKMSGLLTPYPLGPLGVIEEGAYADMILVNGNPLENLDLISDAKANFGMIMKDGIIYKYDME